MISQNNIEIRIKALDRAFILNAIKIHYLIETNAIPKAEPK